VTENKETPKTSTEKVKEKPEDMTFRNEAIAKINALQKENDKLKYAIGRSRVAQTKRKVGTAAGSIASLKKLGSLGSKPQLPS
jgi:hypothetical protein